MQISDIGKRIIKDIANNGPSRGYDVWDREFPEFNYADCRRVPMWQFKYELGKLIKEGLLKFRDNVGERISSCPSSYVAAFQFFEIVTEGR